MTVAAILAADCNATQARISPAAGEMRQNRIRF